MKILILHNEYQQYGGEDAVVKNEVNLLERNDHDVYIRIISNHKIKGFWSKISTALGVVFSFRSYFWLKKELKEIKPDVVHVHNFFPLLSPSIFYACKSLKIPVVFTLHNYRTICPTALLMYNGKVTEQSIDKSPWWAVSKKVYRNSFLATFLLTLMIVVHKKIGTWQKVVDQFIVLTEFARKKFISAGFPADKISIKCNFVDIGLQESAYLRSNKFLYVGRVSPEKGIHILADLVENTSSNFQLNVVGDGPLVGSLKSLTSIHLLGKKSPDEVSELMRQHFALIMPSIWYEGFPMTLVEAYANGLPVIASRIGALEELIEHGVTGLLFEIGNAKSLAECINWALENPDKMYQMGLNARKKYEELYTASENYEQLMAIYNKVKVSS